MSRRSFVHPPIPCRLTRRCYYWIEAYPEGGGVFPSGRYGRYVEIRDDHFHKTLRVNGKSYESSSGIMQVNTKKKLNRILANMPAGTVVRRMVNTRQRGRINDKAWVTIEGVGDGKGL